MEKLRRRWDHGWMRELKKSWELFSVPKKITVSIYWEPTTFRILDAALRASHMVGQKHKERANKTKPWGGYFYPNFIMRILRHIEVKYIAQVCSYYVVTTQKCTHLWYIWSISAKSSLPFLRGGRKEERMVREEKQYPEFSR